MSADPTTPSLFDTPGSDGPKPNAPNSERAPAPDPTPEPAPAPKPRAKPKAKKKPAKGDGVSPMMRQYFAAKKEVGDALLFFRMGDFYELFYEDAKIASRALGLTLTARSKDKGDAAIPMAGVPVKAYDGYLQQLIRDGHRVALCDQVQDPREAKGIVERAVTRIVTAGTVYEDDLLDRRANNHLLAVVPGDDELCGLAWIDVSTGRFRVANCPLERLADDVSRLDPVEVVVPESMTESSPIADCLAKNCEGATSHAPEWTFHLDTARELLTEHFGTQGLAGFGLDDDAPYVRAAGAALEYVRNTQRGELPPVSTIQLHDPAATAALDRATRSCLEILETQRDRRREGSLLSVVDHTNTAMGARLLREWLVHPLVDPAAIERRQGAVAEFLERSAVLSDVEAALRNVPDLERIATRLLAERGSPRDLGALRRGLELVPELRARLEECDSAALAHAASTLTPLPELVELLQRGLAAEPPITMAEGGLIAPGWNAELDEYRALMDDGTSALARFQASEIERTGIPSLKVGFNKVFGYYIEVTHAQAAQSTIPDDYIRKQTLTNAERYITPELKELETKLLSAEDKARALETKLFVELRRAAAEHGEAVRELARALAGVDVLAGFARVASDLSWTRPTVDDSDVLDIQAGRHPVIEARLPPGDFVPNDTRLDRDAARLVLITGPNMAGKSTYIRQTALIVLLAQVGSFVPAGSAHVGAVDRILTRIGAADDLASGQSTFMVEMTETAAILNGATNRSLVILDEVGRGTSTWDGLSLAWAISEYLYQAVGARTLFATHYHELVELADEFPAVRNVNVAVKEWGDEIVFQHRIVPGGTDRSYGLHVARLAGVPSPVLDRAAKVLTDLEQRSPDLRPGPKDAPAGASEPAPMQESLFPKPAAAILKEIQGLEPDAIAPLDALLLLKKYREALGGGE